MPDCFSPSSPPIVVTIVLAVVGTLVCTLVVRALCGGSIRVSEREEREGLDLSQHGERAYPSFTGLDD
jgi:Amt family ammonium transporter